MARIARVVAAGEPHHVIQRGNRRQKVFFKESDRQAYLRILSLQAQLFELDVWAYCLMDNHVHLIVVPKGEESLNKAISETHKLYTRMINFREKWRGCLWEGRFKSSPLDERYLYAAVRYVERNPVRAKLVKKAEDYLWSSAAAHVNKETTSLLSRFHLLDEIKDWSKYLAETEDEKILKSIRRNSQSGRPLGEDAFIERLEAQLGRLLKKRRPGPKKLTVEEN